MSMPPSGIAGQGMDEEAIIEAEIQFELDNINLDNDPFEDVVGPEDLEPVNGDDEGFIQEFNVPDEIDNYIKRIQDQTRKFEEELEECDDLLHPSNKQATHVSLAVIPYDDQQLLDRLAGELGCSVDDYKRKILEDIAQDDFEITDELAEFASDDRDYLLGETSDVSNANDGDLLAITDGRDEVVNAEQDVRLKRDIGKAVEEGIDPSDVPVSQDLLPASKQISGQTNAHVEIQNMLREQLGKLESRYEERLDKLKKDEAFHKAEEEVREKRLTEERLWKKQEYEREEQKIKMERELAERKIQAEQSETEKDFYEQTKRFEREMEELQAETERQKKELKRAMEEERQRQTEKQNKAVVKIQSLYRGYRDRKINTPILKEKREVRQKQREEERIKVLEKEIETRNEEKKRKEEEERLTKEEEKKQKELEKQQKEEEKRRKKEEEEKRKQEEKQRKEEEKQRKEEEKQRKKEEERKRKEEEKLRKEEEKRLKEEQEKQRKEEEKKRKEEEKRQKEEEKKQKIQEQKQKEEEKQQMEVETKQIEEKISTHVETKLIEQKQETLKETSVINDKQREIGDNKPVLAEGIPVVQNAASRNGIDKLEEEGNSDINKQKSESNKDNSFSNNEAENDKSKLELNIQTESNLAENNTIVTNTQNAPGDTKHLTENLGLQDKQLKENTHTIKQGSVLEKQNSLDIIQQSGHIPHPPSPRKKTKSNLQSKLKSEKVDTSLDMTKIDCLPDQLESMRLTFMKDCQSWSKVSNEPWKLKTGLSRKPLRRPSSAKKLPLVPDNVILQAAKVASLQQVTTVQLSDLPGNNVSPLGQCWGLKYLTMNNCNLVAVDSLGQCKQLQYIDVKNNRIEYLDLKDVGQLQYLNVSHNRLSSIHGIDNCSSLRWVDLSHNKITKLGGLETLRRLNTLILSHNQLISAEGLGATPTLQMIDMSHNHLQEINDLEKLCLLLSIDLSSNNLLTIPNLKNQVLLQDVNLSDNSISSVEGLSLVWLPLLTTLNLSQNSISLLTSFQNCVTLKTLDLSNNQLNEFDTISNCVEGCIYLEVLLLEDNPVVADLTDSSFKSLEQFCPRLLMQNSQTSKNLEPLKPRTSFETMCLTQSQAHRDIWNHFETSLKTTRTTDLSSLCDLHHKYCEKTFNTAVEHRYAHEYGEVSVTMPTAPTTPKSGRPKSGRQKETFVSPKDMFENALRASNKPSVEPSANSHTKTIPVVTSLGSNPKDLFENALRASNKPSIEPSANSHTKTIPVVTSLGSNPKDLFEQALKSTECVPGNVQNGSVSTTASLTNGADHTNQTSEDKRMKAIITIQSFWRGWLVRHEIAKQTRYHMTPAYNNIPTDVLEHLNRSAVIIQAMWRGYNLRKKLFAALEYAQCNFEEEEDDDDDAMFGDDFDIDKFVSLDQNLLDDDWKPPDTPDIPAHHPVLKKPPSGHARIPPIPLNDLKPPNNPRKAWRNAESPMGGLNQLSRPPSSVASTDLTARTAVSRKEERLTEEWGFKDTNTAHIMMQRAKKMKYNAERRNKINKLDPKQRLALYRKLEEVTHPRTVIAPQRKTLPRKEYFKARQQEMYQQEQERKEEYHVRASRTFEWLHTQVGDHVVSDSIINKGLSEGPRYMPDLPELQGIRRVQLTSPGSIELQSVESVSSAGHRPRRSSAGTGSSSKLPPIQTSSAPTNHIKERMSFRNPKADQSVGWGGGKKRGSLI